MIFFTCYFTTEYAVGFTVDPLRVTFHPTLLLDKFKNETKNVPTYR